MHMLSLKKLSDKKLLELEEHYKSCIDGERDTTFSALFKEQLVKVRHEQKRREKKKAALQSG
jgi:hypothetical protein